MVSKHHFTFISCVWYKDLHSSDSFHVYGEGTPAMTSRGCLEDDFETIADFLVRAAQIASSVQREHAKLPNAFLKGLENNKEIVELQTQVECFASQFAMPGFDV